MSFLRVVLISVLATAAASAQEAPPAQPFTEQAFVTAIELTVRVTDASGRTPPDLQPSDFTVVENGVERQVIGVEYVTPSIERQVTAPEEEATPDPEKELWDVVLWIDATTTSQATLREAAAQLSSRAAELVTLGPVTLVWANPEPEVIVAGTTDAVKLGEAIEGLSRRSTRYEISRIRREVLTLADDPILGGGSARARAGAMKQRALQITAAVLASVREEVQILSRSRREALEWISKQPGEPPRTVIMVGDGFDLQPSEFYLDYLRSVEGTDPSRYAGELRAYSQADEHRDAARALAITGWTVMAIGGSGGTHFPDDASRPGGQRMTDFLDANPGKRPPSFLALHPRDPFLELADATGGDIVPHAGKLDEVVDDLRNRIVITYQVPRAPDTEPRRIEVRARREGLEVTAPRWASSSPPAALAEARAAALLDGGNAGELPVFVRVNLGEPNAKGVRAGEVEATLDLAKLSGVADRLASTRMRVTVAVGGDDALPIIIQEILPADLSEHPQLHWSAPLNVESGRTRVAVVFEELMTGAWGGATTPLDARVQELARGEAPKVTIPGDWLFDDERAFAKAEAEAEGKAVLGLAFNRYCAECAAIVVESLTHPAVARKIPSFVRLLIDTTTAFERARKPFGLEIAGMTVPPEPLFPELDQRSYFVVFDPSGRERFRLPLENGRGKLLATAELSEFLGRMEELAPLLVEGASLAREGRLVDATRAFGLAYRRAGDLETAAATFARMRDLARSSGDREAAQTAAVLLGLAHLQAGDVGGASRLFEEVVRDPASPASHAEALLGIGQVRRSRGDERGAAEAFVEAARLAPQGSEVRQAAMTLAGAASDVVHGAISLTPESSIEPLQLIIGGRPPFSGRVEAQALVRDPGIDRVAFFLDDAEVAADDAPPFTARIDLGDLPHPRKLRAAAFGVDGALVAEDLLLVNERHDQFWVELSVDGNRAHVETAEPLGRTLERIDFFLDGRRLRSLSASPWQIDIPDAGETSVLRAVARLDDGTFAEDAALLDPEGYVATIEVNEVELYVTALDDGEPVRDLTAADFTVLENGDRKRIHGFEFLEGAPWTAGIAMDSSGSMTLVLPDVQEAARDFAARTIGNGGRAFVVDFDGAPRLAHPTTSDLGSVSAAIDRLTAGGGTALYDAIIFGLLQLQGLDGKRALVVLTDGEDRASRYDYKEAIRVAQESGAAVYAIILDETGPMFSVFVDRLRRELETLARVTGGEAWYLRTRDGIAEVYERIDRELRNQYVLTYGTEPAAGDGEEWRDVEVRARRRGVRVKSIDGYFVR